MARGEVKYRLTADAKEFESGIKVARKEFEGFIKDLGQGAGAIGKVTQAMGPIGVAAAAAMGVAAAGVGVLTKAVVDATTSLVAFGGQLADLEAKTGISTQALQKLAYAGSLVGVSQEEIAGAAVKMERALASNADVFGKLGLSVEKLRAMKPDQAFAEIAAKIATIRDPAGQAAAAMDAFGKSGATMLPLIKSDIAALTKEAERLGIVLDTQTVQAADALGDEATKLAAAWEGVQNQFAASIVENPAILQALQSIVDRMGALARAIHDHKPVISAWVSSIVDGAGTIYRAFDRIATHPVFQKLVMGAAGMASSALQIPALAGIINRLGGDSVSGSASGMQSATFSQITDLTGGLTYMGGKTKEAAQKAAKLMDAHVDTMDDYLDEMAREELRVKARIQEALSGAKMRDLGDIGKFATGLGITSGPSLGKQIFGDLKSVFASLPNVIMSAITGGGSITKGIGAALGGGLFGGSLGKTISDGLGKTLGKTLGGALGSIIPGIGSLLGSGLGGLVGKLFGGDPKKKQQQEELKALRAEFDALTIQAQKAGIALTQTFNPNSAVSMKKAIDELNAALGLQADANNALHQAMERYGITIGQLGPTFAAQELDKQAAQLLQDYRLLTAAGVEHTTVLTQMGPALNDYVQMAIQSGTAIPEAMRPIIQGLIDQHLLLDENGQAYESVEQAGLSFTESMSAQFSTLIDKIDQLVNALLGIPNVERTVTVTERRDTSEGGGYNKGRDEDYTPLASGFEGMVNSPRKFLVGEAGPEYMSVRPAGEAGGVDLSPLGEKLDRLNDYMRTLARELPRSVRDQRALGRA